MNLYCHLNIVVGIRNTVFVNSAYFDFKSSSRELLHGRLFVLSAICCLTEAEAELAEREFESPTDRLHRNFRTGVHAP